jgi:hypothetical protein
LQLLRYQVCDVAASAGENLAAVIATEVDPAEALQIAIDNW